MGYTGRRTDIYGTDGDRTDEEIIDLIKKRWEVKAIANYLEVPAPRVKKLVSEYLKKKGVTQRRHLW